MISKSAAQIGLVLGILCSSPALSQEVVDSEAIAVLRQHGLEASQVMDHLSWICDVHGPRLTGSPNLRRAQEWAVDTLRGFGLKNPRMEPWGPFGRGWQLDGFTCRVVGANPWSVLAYPKAWCPPMPRVEAEVVSLAGRTREEIEAMDLSGKIVLMEDSRDVREPFEPESKRFGAQDLLDMADQRTTGDRAQGPQRRSGDFLRRGELNRLVMGKKPLAVLDRGSKGDYGTVFVSAATPLTPEGVNFRDAPRAWDPQSVLIPQWTLAVEHYNRMVRLLAKGQTVRLELSVEAQYVDGDMMEHNVLADLPGTDAKIRDEVVMIGAHFDSWHTGTGSTDNGCGSAVMIEAMRLLTEVTKALGHGPRRTIRIGLWSGEEQGLMGSRAWVDQNLKNALGETEHHSKISGYFNLDNGTGRIRGVYLQGNEAVAPIFRSWLRPFHDLEASTLTLNDTGGTDHLSFHRAGVPGFQFIQDPVSYSPRTHHSNMDVYDHAVADDLKQAATLVAAFAWHAAQRDEKLPRVPLPPMGGRDR